MKLYLVFFFIFLLSPIVLSQEITFFKEEYTPGETTQLKINLDIDLIQDLSNFQIKITDFNNNQIPIINYKN